MTRAAPAEDLPDSGTLSGEKPISTARRWQVIVLCGLVCLLDGYDMVVAPISVPVMADAWGVEAAGFTAALTGTLLGMALGAVFIAPLGDRIGRRPIVISGFFVVGLSSLLTPLSATVVELTLFRLATGLGMGMSLANAIALAADYAFPHLRSRIVTCVYSLSAVGGVLGGFLAPPLLAAFGWQGLYLVGGVVPLLLTPILFFLLWESPALDGRAGRLGPDKTTSGVVAGVKRLLGSPYRARTLLLWTLYFLSTFTTYLISSWLPTLMRLYGWSIDNSVRAIMCLSLGGIIGGLILGWMVDRGFTRHGLMLGFVAAGTAMLVLNAAPAQIWVWMFLIAVVGASMIGITFTVTALATVVYPADLRAGGVGTASAVGRIGSTLAPVAGGGLLALGLSVVDIFACLVGLMIAGAIIVFRFSRVFQR